MRLFSLSKIFLIKSAAKEDVLKEKYPDFADKIEFYLDKDPTPNKKYIEWMLKQLSLGHPESEVLYFTDYFHKHNSILSSKDLNSYSFEKLKGEFDEYKEDIKRKELKKDNRNRYKSALSEKIYESERFVVYRMDNKAACEKHGLGTQWCITTSDPESELYSEYFVYASENKKHYYIIDKEAKEQELLSKIAYTLGEDYEDIRDTQDEEMTNNDVMNYIGDEFNDIYNVITSDYAKHTTTKEYDNLNQFFDNSTTEQVLREILSDKDIKYYLIDHIMSKQLSEKQLSVLLETGDYEIRRMIAIYQKNLTKDIIKNILEHGDDETKADIIISQNLSDDMIKYIVEQGDDFLNQLIINHQKKNI